MRTMRALVKSRREPGFDLVELPVPTPKPGEMVVKVHATAICGSDLNFYQWNAWAERFKDAIPFIPGHEAAGEVHEIGEGVEGFAPGDHLAIETHIPCGRCHHCLTGNQHICQNLVFFGHNINGSFAEYTAIPATIGRKIPESIPWEHGAVMEPLSVATRAAIEGNVSADSVIITGCGPIGLFAVSAARALGATQIFAVDIQDYRLDIARRLGADFALNPGSQQVIDIVLDETDGYGAGTLLEMSGAADAINIGFQALRKGGTAVMVGLPKEPIAFDFMWNVVFKEATVKGIHGRRMFLSWVWTENLLSQGKLQVDPVITHRLFLADYKEGFDLLFTGRAGKVVLYPAFGAD